MPKISVITPLYNGSKMISETLESILSQDYKDWELIFFDDGSSDGTQELAKKYADVYKDRIFYFEHKENANYGTAYTRNRAVEKSSGEIISFIDQDDIWYTNKLSHQMGIFDSLKDCSMIWGPSLYWYKDRSFKQPVGYRELGLSSRVYNPPEFVRIFLSNFRGTPLPSASLVRRKHFDEAGGYEESIKGSEDIVLWVKLADRFSICYDDEILLKYRKHQDSTLRQATESGKMNEWNLIFYKWVIDFLKSKPGNADLIEEIEFMYYKCLKKMASGEGYFGSRKDLIKGLRTYPDLKKKYFKDFLLDLILPFDFASKVSAKLRFDIFKSK